MLYEQSLESGVSRISSTSTGPKKKQVGPPANKKFTKTEAFLTKIFRNNHLFAGYLLCEVPSIVSP